MKGNMKHLLAYGSVYFFIFAAIAALFPFYPLILQSKGFTPSQIGFIMGGYDLFSIGGLLLLGFIYDKAASHRLTINVLLIITIIILFLLARAQSHFLLIALTFAIGFFVKSAPSLIDAHYGQALPHLVDSYGKTRLGGSIGFMAMALLIQVTGIVDGSDAQSVFYGYAIPLILTIASVFFLPKGIGKQVQIESEKKSDGFINQLKSFPAVYWIGLSIVFLNALALSGHYTFFSLMLKNKFAIDNVSGFWAIGPFFEIPIFFLSPYLFKKVRLKYLWTISMVAGFARMQFYSLSGSLVPLYVIQFTHSLSFGFNHLCMVNLINKRTTLETRGLAMSIFMAIGMGLSLFTGGILGGIILEEGSFTTLFQIFSYFPLAAIIIALVFLRNQEDPSSQEPASTESVK